AGLLQQEINLELITPSVSAFHLDSRTLKIDVDVLDKQRAPRYCGVTLTGLSIQDSPLWLQNRLKAIGLSPINNIVDVTNYVLHELGQPLHAFDAAKISGNKIEVRTLPKGTKFTTLDEVERVLHEEDLMICDAEKPMCIAGVFGGINSGVTEETTSIFLESAYFDPVSIRKTAKRHGLNTDASFRFERGIDPNITEYALKRAVLLILEVAGGEVSSDVVDAYPNKIEDYQVVMSFENAKRLIGEEIPRETIKSILTSLEIKVNNVTETGLGLTVPAYRNDVQREADIIEEILRVYGYNRVPTAEKLNASVSYSSQYEDHRLQNVIGDMLVAKGCFEMMTNSLTTDKYAELTEQINAEEVVTLLNPLSQDLASLRQSMLFSTLETVSYNINRQQVNLKLFEFGKTYGLKEAEFREDKHLALVITGEKNPESWTLESQRSDFFELKGLVQAVIKRLGIHYQDISSVENDYFSEGLTIKVKGKSLVDFGPVKQSVLKSFGIEQPVLFADFNWDMALELAPLSTLSYEDIPKYPEVRRDFALLLDEHVSFDTINTIARKTERKLLKSVNLFDVYQGGKLPKGKKSYAVSFILQDKKKTLTDKQIDKIMARLQANFEKEVGAELR
ncbi:MAG: phenylalanine--tRNA ligase subunit beta, partial [Flavobacteriaceae bacterium]|nr:phenylalanine--tRNA ligase subunit beta [Flavobacteriaceae bacterium]